MNKRLRAALRNPLVIILPIVALGLWGWSVYVNAAHAPNHAERNILPNGSFDAIDTKGIAAGWTIDSHEGVGYAAQPASGFKGGKSFGLQVDKSSQGSVDFKSPVVEITPHTIYLHKGYYKSTTPFTLLVRYFYKDGTSKLYSIKEYESSKEWATESFAFKSDQSMIRVQLVFRMAESGSVWWDRAFLEKRASGVHLFEKDTGSDKPELMTNGDVATIKKGEPSGWVPFSSGDLRSSLHVVHEDGVSFLRTNVTEYKDGEAKWVPIAVPTSSGRALMFSADYRSSAPAYVVAEYVLDDKRRIFTNLSTLPPAGAWTSISSSLEIPEKAKEVTVNIVLNGPGTLDTDNYSLKDITKQGRRHFKRPIVSLAFDNGWASHGAAERIMGYLGYKGTFYINPDTIGRIGYFSKSDLMRMQKNGQQLASQSNEPVDLTALNAPQMSRHMQIADDYFEEELNTSSVDFAPPLARTDQEVQSLAYQHYRSARGSEEGINTKQNFDAYNLKSLPIDKEMTSGRLQEVLDETKKEKGWLILTYDRIQDNSPDSSAVTSKAFTQQIEQIDKSGLTVKTIEGALNEVWAE